MLPADPIGYLRMADHATRHILLYALRKIEERGMPDGHKLLISFRCRNVEMPGWLRAKYPEEMLIVLQHRFVIRSPGFIRVENGELTGAFTVDLTFGGIPVPLTIPYADVVSFNDPAASFAVAFEPEPGESIAVASPVEPPRCADVIHLHDFRRSS